ncbi:MAG: glycosyltransferase family 4 protein [Acidobacteriia bacterium]|nr:glycosyltransferase family 4 protein [Terriglobia bacterium]MBV8902872.1 glycosyltransferase family 4 protein [Terriglobia bacterium]
MGKAPKIAILYHFFYPDDVVSARHFSDLAEGLVAAGWEVEVLPSNRGCRNPAQTYRPREQWRGMNITRVWRPRFAQSRSWGRILNALWMIAAWSCIALRGRARRPDVVLVGTDPILSVLVALLLKWLRPEIKLAHWAFDLYPEAAIADGLLSGSSKMVRALTAVLRRAYAGCDLIADLGVCMRRRLEAYGSGAAQRTIVPWALAEEKAPMVAEPALRQKLFGDASLALLYSGNLGRAHAYREFLELARSMRSTGAQFRWSVRGNAVEEFRSEIRESDTNIGMLGFVPESELVRHLAAADIHLVSLKPEWSGVVVPSKFFGSLAAGRPVLFAGPEDSCVARWIREYRVGWVLNSTSFEEIGFRLRYLAANPERLRELEAHCFHVYERYFSRDKMINSWARELRQLIRIDSAHTRGAYI